MADSRYRRFPLLTVVLIAVAVSFAALFMQSEFLEPICSTVGAPVPGPCGKCPCCQMAAIDARLAVDSPGMHDTEQGPDGFWGRAKTIDGPPPSTIPITSAGTYKWKFDGTPGVVASAPVPGGVPPLMAVQVHTLTWLRNRWSVDLIDLYDVSSNKRIKSVQAWSLKEQPGYDSTRVLCNFGPLERDHEYRLELYLYPENDDALRNRMDVIQEIAYGEGLRVHSDFAMASGGTLK